MRFQVRSFNVKEDVDVEGLFARFMSAPVDMEEAARHFWERMDLQKKHEKQNCEE
jgi:hypothetical protein